MFSKAGFGGVQSADSRIAFLCHSDSNALRNPQRQLASKRSLSVNNATNEAQ